MRRLPSGRKSPSDPLVLTAAAGPAALLFALWLLALAVADLAPRPAWVDGALLTYAALLLLGPSLIYPAARARGAGSASALAGSLLVPIAWIAKECLAVGRLYSAGEALYYALNPVALGVLAAGLFQVALAELVLRYRAERRRPCGWPLVVLGVIAGSGITIAFATRHTGPTAVYWTYVGLHHWLFGD